MSERAARRWRLGALAWRVRTLYLPVELAVALVAVGGYRLLDDTVSDLGLLGCRADGVCSPAHPVMNAAFGVAGTLLAVGALLLHGRFGSRGPRAVVATAALVVTGVATVLVGLVPIDRDPTLHYAVAAPIFVAQPVGLLLLGALCWTRARGVALTLLGAGALAVVGAVLFVTLGEGAPGRGAWERVALWPAFVALALAPRAVSRTYSS